MLLSRMVKSLKVNPMRLARVQPRASRCPDHLTVAVRSLGFNSLNRRNLQPSTHDRLLQQSSSGLSRWALLHDVRQNSRALVPSQKPGLAQRSFATGTQQATSDIEVDIIIEDQPLDGDG